MRAYVLPTAASSPVFADVPRPQPADDEVLVRVTASSVNSHDVLAPAKGHPRVGRG